MNDLIKSISIPALLMKRDSVIERVAKAHALLVEARTIAASEGFGDISSIFPGNGRYVPDSIEPFLRDGGLESVVRWLDSGAWEHLMSKSGIKTFMDAESRARWYDDIKKAKCPPLTAENISTTFEALYGARLAMFEKGVLAIFRALSWDYKTNQPFKFGKRIVMHNFLDTYRTSGKTWHSGLSHPAADRLDDLVRAFRIFEGRPELDHRDGAWHSLRPVITRSDSANGGRGVCETEFFAIRWFKNGHAHVTFRRPDLVDRLNKILAKHYPGALAYEEAA